MPANHADALRTHRAVCRLTTELGAEVFNRYGNGMKLHEFDLDLCRYVLQNVRYHLRKDRFAAFAADAVNPEVFGYLQSLRRDDEPPPMLLNAAELIDLAEVFAGGPFEFDRPWEAYESLHRRSIECVTEIRATLTPHHAQEWSVA